MYLEREQEDLLLLLIEAQQKVDRAEGREFFFMEVVGGSHVMHPGWPKDLAAPPRSDLEVLELRGLIRTRYHDPHSFAFYLTPEATSHVRKLRAQHESEPAAVTEALERLVSSERFRKKYPKAWARWSEANHMLTGASSSHHFTTIGHLCREAMQEFAEVLVAEVPAAVPDKTATVKRLRAAIAARGLASGAVAAYLDALVTLWGCVSDLVQRQEHGGAKEREPISAEDARRVVFSTLMVFFEVDRALA